jgi:D-glycero-alpha-D-manno-heptose-7-phosphate kinase
MANTRPDLKFHVRSIAPTRVDLAGGTIDLWPIHQLLEEKATVNCAVTLPAQVDIKPSLDGHFTLHSVDQRIELKGSYDECVRSRELPLLGLFLKAWWSPELPPLTIRTEAKSPAGAGLGGSSCLAVTLGGALLRTRDVINGTRTNLDEFHLVQTASDIEAKLIHAPTGIQDYWGAVRGGLNIIEFPAGRVTVETHDPAGRSGPAIVGHRLEEELILCYSGKSRQSAINNWEIFKRVFDGDKNLLEKLASIGSLARKCADAVRAGDYAGMLKASSEEWDLRCQLWPNIHTEETRKQAEAAMAAGASLARVCGAGGGGVMAVIAPAAARSRVQDALAAAGGSILAASIAHKGLTSERIL